MTNDTKIAETFLFDIFPKAAARDGKAMVRRNSLWYILLTFLSPPTEITQCVNFYSVSLVLSYNWQQTGTLCHMQFCNLTYSSLLPAPLWERNHWEQSVLLAF